MRPIKIMASLAVAAAAVLTACGSTPSRDDKYMTALAAAHFPATLIADRTHALEVGRDTCGGSRGEVRFRLMSELDLTAGQVDALDAAAHKYLC